jgi:hypothetical protein
LGGNDETRRTVPSVSASVTSQAQGSSQQSFTFESYLNNVKSMSKHVIIKERGAETASGQGKDGFTSAIIRSILKPIFKKSAAVSILSNFTKSDDSIPDANKYSEEAVDAG